MYYAYCDASFDANSNLCVIANIIENKSHKIIYKSIKVIKCKNSTEGEFRALNKLLEYILNKLENGILKNEIIKVKGDNLGIVNSINKNNIIKGVERSQFISLVNTYQKIRAFNKNTNIKWISRKCNKIADILARETLRELRGKNRLCNSN